jgi:hypothetical protein
VAQPHVGSMSGVRSRLHIHVGRVLFGSAVLMLVASACAGESKHSRAAMTSSTASRMPTATSAYGPAISPVPARFAPESFTAVSDRDYWLLGRIPCRDGRCHAIVATTDGGKTFVRINTPPLPKNRATPTLRFADRRDGFAYVPQAVGVLYATHDGGVSWQRLGLGDVLAFAIAGGRAYAVAAHCSLQGCVRHRFDRAPVGSNRWAATALPFAADGSLLDLEALESRVWLLGTRAGRGIGTNELSRSSNGGRTFVTGRGPCNAGLGGELAPASPTVVWALCSGGLLAVAWRSTDGGATFTRLKTPPLANSAALAAASARVAVLGGNGAGSHLFRTTDGGRSWKPTRTPGLAVDIGWIGFSSTNVGTALVHAGNDQANVLWRTTDGGAHWSTVPLR